MKTAVFKVISAVLVLFAAPAAWGHGIELFAGVEGGEIRGLLQYHDGPPVTRAPIRAYAPDGEMIVETATGEDGRFAFPVSRRCDYRIVGDAGEGHLGTYTVKESELPAASPAGGAADAPEGSPAATGDLDARIEAAVARQLTPLREQLFNHEQSTRFRDILGGVGYLFGLAGLVALLKRRKSPES